ncbi:MAG: SDR family NAD(P)-dependent oxidoreductase [Candidatus Pacebacteria bacterium]|nr:SDR family NAD(P)-dependent oxidoreductase [Candidatus Paceibacterota bacterium]
MKGKVVLITGATRGIGRSGAIRLAGLGARLILVGRHRGRLEEVARLSREAGAPEVTLYVVDLSQRKEVMDLVEKLITRGGKLDVLWNNAGGYFTERRVTKEGLERTWALNHIAYVDLTQGLIPLLEKSEDPRVICTASEAHRMGVLRWDNLQGERSWNGWKAYCLTKLANILYVAEQGRRLQESKIRICAVHPGLVNSALGDENQGFSGVAFRLLKLFFGKTNEEGADTALWLASRTTRPTQGAYYAYRKERIPKASAQSLGSAQQLWEISQRA